MTLKPQLIAWLLLFRYFPLILRLAVVSSLLGGTLAFFLSLVQVMHFSLWSPFIYCGVTVFMVLPVVILGIYRYFYDEIEYRFYQTHLEYSEGFWTIRKKIIAYRNITQVNLRRGMIQRWYRLGTIYLTVPGGTGILIHDISEPEQIYQRIQEIVKEAH